MRWEPIEERHEIRPDPDDEGNRDWQDKADGLVTVERYDELSREAARQEYAQAEKNLADVWKDAKRDPWD